VTSFGSSLAIVYAYNASNTSGHTKKVTVNAMTLAAFCVGNIVGSETFLPKDSPNYIPGKTAMLILLCVSLALCMLIRWVNVRLNVRKRLLVARMKAENGWSEEDLERERQRHAFLDLTDKECVPIPPPAFLLLTLRDN
jgi:MFS transporter, ACS family, allantoate permease